MADDGPAAATTATTPVKQSLLVVAGAWTPEFCAAVQRAMDEGRADRAEILDADVRVDEDVRRALDVTVAETVLEEVERALERERARAAAFFGVPLRGSVGVSFVRYRTGGRYRRHRDRDPRFDTRTGARLVTVVVWLNSTNSPPATSGAFAGGMLKVIEPRSGQVRDLRPTTGTLVAFPADWPHEVMPVTQGTRDVVVDWWL